MSGRWPRRHSQRTAHGGFTLLEQLIAMGIASVVLAGVILGVQIWLETFDRRLDDTQLWTDLREGIESIKRDLRDARVVTHPPTAGLLTTFTAASDGLTYSYYINAQGSLVRQIGTTGIGGRVIAMDLDPVASTVTKTGDLVTINLEATKHDQRAYMMSSVRARNL